MFLQKILSVICRLHVVTLQRETMSVKLNVRVLI